MTRFIEEQNVNRFAWSISGPDEASDDRQKCETYLIFDIVKRF